MVRNGARASDRGSRRPRRTVPTDEQEEQGRYAVRRRIEAHGGCCRGRKKKEKKQILEQGLNLSRS